MKTFISALCVLICCAGMLHAQETVTLLNGKLKLVVPKGFVTDTDKVTGQSIAGFKAAQGDAWGSVLRGTHGLRPEGLQDYMGKKVAEYTKGLSWLPKLVWLKKEIVTIDGRPWADMRFVAPRTKAKNPRDGLMYTRMLSTSYDGQLLELTFTSNTDPDPATKDRIDQIIESAKLAE